MNDRWIRKWVIMAGVMVAMLLSNTAWAEPQVDHSEFASLLQAHVEQGQVDYAGFKKDEKRLDRYLARLAQVNPETLERSEQMAYYINTYNAWTIKLILKNFPGVKSIKDLGTLFKSPWKKKLVQMNGKKVTLDYIEHDVLRPVFKDPRIHFAVNCASKSCPPLLDQPFTGTALERQLNQVTSNFINDPKSNYIQSDTLYVSRIFKWFGEDFGNDILGFFRSHAVGELAQKIAKANNDLKVKYLNYDWSLNST